MSGQPSGALVAALVVLGLGCSSSSDEEPPPPDYATIFDTLKPATPNKLRGVWGTTQRDEKGSVEIRIKFVDGYAIGGARCIPTNATRSVIAGTAVGLETTALDAATGTFTTKAPLSFSRRDGDILCQVTVAGANRYEFTVTQSKLTLSVANSNVSSSFDKLGD